MVNNNRLNYLKNCSPTEKVIRKTMKTLKYNISYYKEELQSVPTRADIIANQLESIRIAKIQLTACRIALRKLKNNKLKILPISYKDDYIPLYGFCNCGNIVLSFDKYCSKCGIKITWKDVNKINEQRKCG